MKRRLPLFLVLTLAACEFLALDPDSTVVSPAERAARSWIEVPVEEAFRAWGRPDETRNLKEGRHAYDWKETEQVWEKKWNDDEEEELVLYTCRTSLIANADGIVTGTERSGECGYHKFKTYPFRPAPSSSEKEN